MIMVVVAGAGILRLWLLQRKEESRLDAVDDFRLGLEAISVQTSGRGARVYAPTSHRPMPVRSVMEKRVVVDSGPANRRYSSPSPQPLDPARRAAAKRRIEARRRALGTRVAS